MLHKKCQSSTDVIEIMCNVKIIIYYYLAVPFFEVNRNRIIRRTRAWFTTMNEYLDKLSVDLTLSF